MKKIVFVNMMLCLCGCAMFKKTSKTTAVAKESSVKNVETAELVLKRTGRETQTFTYWNDSGIYQVQTIREQLDQAKITETKTGQKSSVKNETLNKRREPIKGWLLGLTALILLIILFLLKLHRF